jgi:hypothetical protein
VIQKPCVVTQLKLTSTNIDMISFFSSRRHFKESHRKEGKLHCIFFAI